MFSCVRNECFSELIKVQRKEKPHENKRKRSIQWSNQSIQSIQAEYCIHECPECSNRAFWSIQRSVPGVFRRGPRLLMRRWTVFTRLLFDTRLLLDISVPRAHHPAPGWPWGHKCTVAFKKKNEAFTKRVSEPELSTYEKLLGTYSRCSCIDHTCRCCCCIVSTTQIIFLQQLATQFAISLHKEGER